MHRESRGAWVWRKGSDHHRRVARENARLEVLRQVFREETRADTRPQGNDGSTSINPFGCRRSGPDLISLCRGIGPDAAS